MKGTIVIFAAHFLPHVGGVEVFADGLSRSLERQGFQVVVVTSRLDDAPERERLSDGVEVLRLPCWPLVGGRLPVARPGRRGRELLASLDGRDIVAVVVNTRFYPLSLVGARFARRHGLVPLVIDHGADYLTFGNAVIDVAVRAYEHVITALAKRSRPRFYGVSEASARWLGTFGIEADGIITNAIDGAAFRRGASGRSFRWEFGIADDAVLVAYTGRLIPEKGVGALVDAAGQLATAGENVAFVLAGDGPLREPLEARGVPMVRFAGRLDAADVAALLLESDIFCFPSRSEGFGSSLLEAAVCGCALVSTDVGIARGLIGEEGGIVLADADARGVADAVRALAGDRERLNRAKNYERQRSESLYTWEESVANVIDAAGLDAR